MRLIGREGSRLRRLAVALGGCFALAVAACTTNPATGQAEFTPFLGSSEEAQLGAQEHPKILEAFGGAYEDAELQTYVTGVGRRLVTQAGLPGAENYTFTVLDSPVVNAMALPGGYVYVTRGLIAYANSEAELAGVMAHEIGHVTARHTAKRYNRSVFAQIGSSILGAVIGNPSVAQLAGVGAQLYLLSYSRDQEYEADLLGVQYMAESGYDPSQQADFLATLQALDQLQERIEGRQDAPMEFFSTHPNTAERVRRAIEAAREQGTVVQAQERGQTRFLQTIEGMVYGDSPEEGFVRGHTFLHPDLRFAFTVPDEFRIENTPEAILAFGPENSLIQVDAAPAIRGLSIDRFLRDKWAQGAMLQNAEVLDINGMAAATATTGVRTNAGDMLARLIAIELSPERILRIVIVTPPELAQRLSVPLRRFTYSVRRLSAEEASKLEPLRVAVVTVKPGDTVEALARRMAYPDYQVERFRVLNGLDVGRQLTAGQQVKIVQ